MIRALYGMLAVLLILASPLQAQLYQWTDEKGVKHFSNSPPPEDAADVRQYEEVKNETESETPGESPALSSPEGQLPVESEEVIGAGGETAESESETPGESPVLPSPEEQLTAEDEEVIGAEGETAGEVEAETTGQLPAEDEEQPQPTGEEEVFADSEGEGAGEEAETGETEDIDEEEEGAFPDLEADTDIDKEAPGTAATSEARANELIEQEMDRLEIRITQLNSRLEEAQVARDRGSSYEREEWNKRIEQIQSEIENEISRSDARIAQIRLNAGMQP